MKRFRADLHIHTVLSACADLDMSPGAIVSKAKEKNIDLIGVTDHNTTLHCSLVKEIADQQGIEVLLGVEVTTREEVHCLAFFEGLQTLQLFQEYLDGHLPVIPYKAEKFGYQALVDQDERILRMIDGYLNVALDRGIGQVEKEVHRLGGLFVPAHIERPMFGIFNHLGFLPVDLDCDALGIMSRSSESVIRTQFRLPDHITLIKASDAHALEDIGSGCTWLEMNDLSFGEIKKAFRGIEGRKAISE